MRKEPTVSKNWLQQLLNIIISYPSTSYIILREFMLRFIDSSIIAERLRSQVR